jgi:hypothetical protein
LDEVVDLISSMGSEGDMSIGGNNAMEIDVKARVARL